MNTISDLYEAGEREASEFLNVPAWIDQSITCSTVAAILEGGCASGSYMPAVTYRDALETMREHGDDVLEYVETSYGELPAVKAGESWAGLACFYLSAAVELWASGAAETIVRALADSAE